MASIEQSTSRGKSIVFVHGRGRKPDAGVLQDIWTRALRAGIARDAADITPALDNAHISLAYYGDLNNERRAVQEPDYDETLDLADLNNTLHTLETLPSAKKFRRASYENLPGRSSTREFLADIGAPILSALRLTEVAIAKRIPELAAYWQDDAGFAQNARQRVRERLREAFGRGDDVLLICHCLGSVICYDALWELSHMEALPNKVDTLVTLGSPLADEFVKRHLRGAEKSGAERYPTNLLNWHNVSAEDDFTCHDETVANDFAPMLEQRLISRIKDYRIYNLAVRYGNSNPHNFIGYLIHPRMAGLVSDWLST